MRIGVWSRVWRRVRKGWYSRALSAAEATAEPPFSDTLLTAGNPLSRNAALDSTAPTKPTGSPMTSAGAASRVSSSSSAVGALPITQSAPGPTCS